MAGFSLAHLQRLDTRPGKSGHEAPGERYWFQSGHRKLGLLLHLGAILPCGVLLVIQFVPIIRQKYSIIHRINGYIVLILMCLGVAGGLMMTSHAFGGGMDIHGAMYVLAILVVGSASLGYYNIKRMQIEEHRKWMLRTAVYLGSIITIRIIMIISAHIISMTGGYSSVWTCDEIKFTLNNDPAQIAQYGSPDCVNAPGDRQVLVPANMKHGMVGAGSALRTGFANATWIALIIHLILLEIYLHLTPSETARLREISYEKQLESGHKHPGSSGLTSDRLGDAPPYHPASHQE